MQLETGFILVYNDWSMYGTNLIIFNPKALRLQIWLEENFGIKACPNNARKSQFFELREFGDQFGKVNPFIPRDTTRR